MTSKIIDEYTDRTDLTKHKKWQLRHPGRFNECRRRSNHKHPVRTMWRQTKKRAKEKGFDFTITYDDIIIPEVCPILFLTLDPVGSGTELSPSMDRIDSTKGYIKGNVRVISKRANAGKSSLTLEDARNLVRYMEKGLE